MKLIRVVSLSAVFLLAACGGNNGFTPEKSSLIIISRYSQPKDVRSIPLSETLTGSEYLLERTSYFATRVFFKKEGSDETLVLYIPASSWEEMKYMGKYVSPGTYELTQFELGNMIIPEYDSAKCGKISIQVNPNELVYIGGLKPYPNTDIVNKRYKHTMPYFEADKIPTYDDIVRLIHKKDSLNYKTKNLVTRLPQSTLSSIPSDCVKEAIPIWGSL